ncbi:MAG TPA: membrane-bound lytic murein transglycosylase MltF [Steroidobacteraceae bacterium]|jgi:membrane-bound lytic murein transglycosylase F|nr:membrane-bound lytic murein transglycosylase MltF [Steroidobacteraceae bacterium]
MTATFTPAQRLLPARAAAHTRLRSAAGSLLLAALWLCGCSAPAPHSALAQIRSRGTLRVVTLSAPTSYYLGTHGPQGFDYRLASAFAQQLGVKLQIDPVLDAAAMRAALMQDRADLAAAQISADEPWEDAGRATLPYGEATQLVVRARDEARVERIADLCGARIVVRSDSPQAHWLHAVRDASVPKLAWRELTPADPDPLDLLESGQADYALIDAREFDFARHLYPDVTVAVTLPRARPLQWVVRADAPDLVTAANGFLTAARASGLVASIEQRSGSESLQFDYLEALHFRQDIQQRLPELQALFQQAAQLSGLDWRLIAAVGYQESKWQMQAVSSDGARGIMMLTSEAASRIGVTDRDNLRDNILGGARYLAQVMHTIPRHVPEPDRTWLALAAYNVGYGHLEDARVLTQKLGGNPDSWQDVREQLPLLAEQQWYQQARRGYARGAEPARFVEQVRQYLAVLEWFDTSPLSLHAPTRVLRAALLGDSTHYD